MGLIPLDEFAHIVFKELCHWDSLVLEKIIEMNVEAAAKRQRYTSIVPVIRNPPYASPQSTVHMLIKDQTNQPLPQV